jgi:hypothetical protein
MSTPNDPVGADILEDLQEAARYAATGAASPEILQRIQERAQRVREGLRQKHGDMEVAVSLLHEARDEE